MQANANLEIHALLTVFSSASVGLLLLKQTYMPLWVSRVIHKPLHSWFYLSGLADVIYLLTGSEYLCPGGDVRHRFIGSDSATAAAIKGATFSPPNYREPVQPGHGLYFFQSPCYRVRQCNILPASPAFSSFSPLVIPGQTVQQRGIAPRSKIFQSPCYRVRQCNWNQAFKAIGFFQSPCYRVNSAIFVSAQLSPFSPLVIGSRQLQLKINGVK